MGKKLLALTDFPFIQTSKRKRAGHLFQGRYKALLIDVDNYLLELSRYIHLNPARARIKEKPEEYPRETLRKGT